MRVCSSSVISAPFLASFDSTGPIVRIPVGQIMRVSDASALLGKIVTLELIGGIRLTTKVESVDRDPETGRFYLRTGRLLVFLMQHQEGRRDRKDRLRADRHTTVWVS